MKKAVIVVPTYKEADNINELLEKIDSIRDKSKGWEIEVLIVDSNSPDGTASLVKKSKVRGVYLLETEKEGLGKAYVNGFNYALKKLSPDVLFEMDADLSHDPAEIPIFLKKIDEGADFVIGSRYMKGGSIPKDWSFDRKLLSVVGNLIIRLGFMKLKISDWTSGYRAIKAEIVSDALNYISKYSGYVFQVALLDFAVKRHAAVTQIPINFIDRRFGHSKINSIQYTIHTLFYVFTKSSFIRYGIVGVIGFCFDFGLLYYLREKVNLYIWLAQTISAEVAIVVNFILNNYWSFSHKKIEHSFSKFMQSFLKFNLVASGSIVIQAVLLELSAYLFGEKYLYLYKVLILGFVIIPYSYVLYNRVIWKPQKS